MAKVLVTLGGSAKNGTLCAKWCEVVPPEYFGNRKGPRQTWDAVQQKLFIECLRSMEDSSLIVRDNTNGWAYAFTVTLTEKGRKFADEDKQAVTFWSDEEMKLFGHHSDERIAQITGRSVQAVQHCRNEKNIPPYMPKARPWTQAELEMLGTKSDKAVSAAINRSLNAVRNKRTLLGRPPVLDGRYHRWTPEEDKQLGTMPDTVLAKKLGVSQEAVWCRRKKAHILCYKKPAAQPPAPEPAPEPASLADSVLS